MRKENTMTGKRRSFSDRVLALVLTLLITVSGIIPVSDVSVEAAVTDQTSLIQAEETQEETSTLEVTPTPEVTPPPEEVEKISVGFVIADKNGNALDNCAIVFQNPETDEVQVEAQYSEGKYIAENVLPNQAYKVIFEKTGYVSREFTFVFTPESAEGTTSVIMYQDDIKLDKTDVAMNVGTTEIISVLNTILVGDKAAEYVWISDNANVASVENGTITAVAEGTANITVSNGEKSASVAVTVTKNDSAIILQVNPNEGNDVDEITCKVYDIPKDATGTVTLYVNDEEVAKIDASKTEFTYSVSDKIIGQLRLKAVYSGDNKYAGSTYTAIGTYTKTLDLELESEKMIVEPNPAVNEKQFTVPVKVDTVGERELIYESDNEKVAVVDQDGNVTVLGADQETGLATITVTAIKNDNYSESKVQYPVIVQNEIDLETLSTWETVEKVYDKDGNVTLTALLSGSAKNVNKIVAEFRATVDPNAGTGKDATLVELVGVTGEVVGSEPNVDLKECYIFKNENAIIEGIVNINKITVYLGTEDLSEQLYYLSTNVKNKSSLKTDTGLIDGDTIAFAEMRATTKSGQDMVFDVKTHIDEIIPDMNVIEDIENYHFESVANLNADSMKEIFGELEVTEMLGDLQVID